jgi:uncharacterized repeat protein (TIGR03847 family)
MPRWAGERGREQSPRVLNMQRQVFDYDPPDRFVAGTVGEPGNRTFYLQASGGGRVTTVALEKQQVAALAERVDEILDELLRLSGGTAAPALAPAGLEDHAPLDTPLLEDFRVGTLSLAWDPDGAVLVIEAHAAVESAEAVELDADAEPADPVEGDEQEGDLLRVRLQAAAARAFAKRATAVVGAGRPPCPFCGLPLDATGHLCPRQNGYRRR